MLESIVLRKLDKYTKPIKTKHLAERVGVDRVIITETLNKLHSQNEIAWHKPKRTDKEQYVGWIINRN